MSFGSTAIDDLCHREPITAVKWIRDGSTGTTRSLLVCTALERRAGLLTPCEQKKAQLVSISGDGKILFWAMSNKLQRPRKGFALVPTAQYHGKYRSTLPPACPFNLPSAGHGSSMNRFPIMGGASVAFSPLDAGNCVYGTEAGGVLKCVHGRYVWR